MAKRFDVVSIGNITYDIFLVSKYFKPIKEEHLSELLHYPTDEAECFALGAKIEVEKLYKDFGGGALNSATTFARQGLKAGIFSKIGNDLEGKEVQKIIKKEKITPFILKRRLFTPTSFILLSPQGERTILTYRGQTSLFDFEDLKKAIKLKPLWFYITPSNTDIRVLKKFLKTVGKQTKIALNPSLHQLNLGVKKNLPLIQFVDLLILNQEEASVLFNLESFQEKLIIENFKKIFNGILVITQGKEGSLVLVNEKLYRASIFPEREIIDRTGAGDAFGSGFLAGLINNQGKLKDDELIYEAIRTASANATSVIENLGARTGILTKRELKNIRWQRIVIRTEELI